VLWADWMGWYSPLVSVKRAGRLLGRCERLAWRGLRFEDAANAVGSDCISVADSATEVRIIATDEETMIAHYTLALIRQRSRTSADLPATLLEQTVHGIRDEIEWMHREIEAPS
jgi:hypothetical protein